MRITRTIAGSLMLFACVVTSAAADVDSVRHKCANPLTDSIHAIVVDAETGMRISNASVRLDNGEVTKSKWDGSVAVRNNFSKATISSIGYMARKMDREEIGDTITLFSTNIHLNEVVVYGIKRKGPDIHFKGIDHTTAQLMKNSGGGGLNLLGLVSYLIPKKNKSSKKEEVKRKLDNY